MKDVKEANGSLFSMIRKRSNPECLQVNAFYTFDGASNIRGNSKIIKLSRKISVNSETGTIFVILWELGDRIIFSFPFISTFQIIKNIENH